MTFAKPLSDSRYCASGKFSNNLPLTIEYQNLNQEINNTFTDNKLSDTVDYDDIPF